MPIRTCHMCACIAKFMFMFILISPLQPATMGPTYIMLPLWLHPRRLPWVPPTILTFCTCSPPAFHNCFLLLCQMFLLECLTCDLFSLNFFCFLFGQKWWGNVRTMASPPPCCPLYLDWRIHSWNYIFIHYISIQHKLSWLTFCTRYISMSMFQ